MLAQRRAQRPFQPNWYARSTPHPVTPAAINAFHAFQRLADNWYYDGGDIMPYQQGEIVDWTMEMLNAPEVQPKVDAKIQYWLGPTADLATLQANLRLIFDPRPPTGLLARMVAWHALVDDQFHALCVVNQLLSDSMMLSNARKCIAGRLTELIQEDPFTIRPNDAIGILPGGGGMEMSFMAYKINFEEAQEVLKYHVQAMKAETHCTRHSLPLLTHPDRAYHRCIRPLWNHLAVQTILYREAELWVRKTQRRRLPNEIKITVEDLGSLERGQFGPNLGTWQWPSRDYRGHISPMLYKSHLARPLDAGAIRTAAYLKWTFTQFPMQSRLGDGGGPPVESIHMCQNDTDLRAIGTSMFTLAQYEKDECEWTLIGPHFWVLRAVPAGNAMDHIVAALNTSLCMRSGKPRSTFTVNGEDEGSDAIEWSRNSIAKLLVASGRARMEDVQHFVNQERVEAMERSHSQQVIRALPQLQPRYPWFQEMPPLF